MLYIKYAQEHINMPKKDSEKNDEFAFKFSTSNKANNLNKKYIKNTIEQVNSE